MGHTAPQAMLADFYLKKIDVTIDITTNSGYIVFARCNR